jgi:hypothetical protein
LRIVVIGYTGPGDESFVIAAHFLLSNGWNDALADIELAIEKGSSDAGIYDMATRPESGDGIGAIDHETDLVVALHLNGMRGQDPDAAPGPMYNACNGMLLPLCKELRIPLLVVGDQPTQIDELAVMYVEEGECLADYQLLENA